MLQLILGFASVTGPLFAEPVAPVAGQSLHVEIVGLRSNRGRVRCALHNCANGYPKDQTAAVDRVTGPITKMTSSCVFSHVPQGRYALSVYHDENGNGRMDANFLGIPREGVGVSNDAKGRFGPPKFEDASFLVDGKELFLTIHIRYF